MRYSAIKYAISAIKYNILGLVAMMGRKRYSAQYNGSDKYVGLSLLTGY